MAVADDAITNPIPEVRPFAFNRMRPAAVVAALAVTVSMYPVVVRVPAEVRSRAPPVVRPANVHVDATAVEIVALVIEKVALLAALVIAMPPASISMLPRVSSSEVAPAEPARVAVSMVATPVLLNDHDALVPEMSDPDPVLVI